MPTNQKAELDFMQSKLPVGVEDEDEKGDIMSKGKDVVHGVSACSFSITTKTGSKAMIPLLSQVHSSGTMVSCEKTCFPTEGIEVLKQSTKEVVNYTSENLPSESEVFINELGHQACGSFMSLEFPSCEDSKQLGLSLQNTLSSGRDDLIKQILRKYGDITKGSILKSMEAKTAFLQLVAKVVERLHSHTLDTIDAHEMYAIQKLTDDAATVGFDVEWLQQRIKKIVAVSKYRDYLMQLNEISEKINDTKIALLEMELQHMILKKETDSMKAEMDMEELCVSSLCVGLL